MVEAFVAEHNITIDEVLYGWPATKFEAFYSAFAKRRIADELSQRRGAEIAALWGNPNLDNENDPQLRQKFMEEVNKNYNIAIAQVYGEQIDEMEIDEDDPFWQAAQRGISKHKLPGAEDM